MIAQNCIKRTKSGWAVYDTNGDRKSAYFGTKEQAAGRLVAIEQQSNAQRTLVPTSMEQDPTKQAANRRAAKKAIVDRMQQAQTQVLDLFYSIPVKRIEVNSTIEGNRLSYQYDIDADRLEKVFDEIAIIINRMLETQRATGKPARWFFEQFIRQAYQQGTADSAERLRALYEAFTGENLTQLQLEQILTSEQYRRRIEIVFARVFEDMVGFAGDNAVNLGRILADGVARGVSPRRIASSIRKEFDDIKSWRALRIARTEVNQAYTTARAEQSKDARDRLGIDLQIMHVSALVKNTRASHAQRHGNLYSIEQQESWWSEGANRINCLCSTMEIMFIDGTMMQKDLVEKVRERGKIYFQQNPRKA